MAGETVKTAARTKIDGKGKAKASHHGQYLKKAHDFLALATTEMEAGDIVKTAIKIPSNAVIDSIYLLNDDADSGTTITLDIGLEAGSKFTSVTSGTPTNHLEGAVIDIDLFVDGSTTLQGATTVWTAQSLDTDTFGADDVGKAVWQMLGYDKDPMTDFYIVASTITAGDQAADVGIKVYYTE